MENHFQDFLIIDIETVSGKENIEEISPQLQQCWEHKAGSIRNPEEKNPKDLYQDRAAIYAEFGKVIVIGLAFFHEVKGKPAMRVKSMASHDEQSLLLAFKNFIDEKFNQHRLKLCAHNGKEFDFPYLCRRMLINDIKIPNILNIANKKPWEVPHIDTMELWKFGDWKSFTSLDLLTAIFEIPSSKKEMDGSMVTQTYYEEEDGLKKIEEYCRGDVIATAQLYLRLNNLPLIEEQQISIIH
ncbi:MAG: 3'-5' exonuclease [Ekhidna sp.]|nr:3'-5' exonuclease [Ekhidna sp.]MBC6425853.1 3'-5' exonuclease [Ekhidna sp.]